MSDLVTAPHSLEFSFNSLGKHSVKRKDARWLNRLVWRAGSGDGKELCSLTSVAGRRILLSLMDSVLQHLHSTLTSQSMFSGRLLSHSWSALSCLTAGLSVSYHLCQSNIQCAFALFEFLLKVYLILYGMYIIRGYSYSYNTLILIIYLHWSPNS